MFWVIHIVCYIETVYSTTVGVTCTKFLIQTWYWVSLSLFCGATAQVGSRPPSSLDHTQLHTRARARGRTHLNELSTRRKSRHLHNTQQTQEWNIHALRGSRNPKPKAASDVILGSRGHRDRPLLHLGVLKFLCYLYVGVSTVSVVNTLRSGRSRNRGLIAKVYFLLCKVLGDRLWPI